MTTSYRKAIDEKCKSCTYDELAPGTWRMQTEECTVRSCPLWEVRPVTMATKRANADPERSAKMRELNLTGRVGRGR